MATATLTATVDVRSRRDVAAALAGVKAGVQNRVVKAAVAKVARLAAKAVKKGAPASRTGALKRSIGTSYKSRPKAGQWTYKAGPRKGFTTTTTDGRKVNPVNYAHLVEGGRKEVRPKRKSALRIAAGVVRKRAQAVAAKPFVAPVWRGVQGRGVAMIGRDIKAGIAREAAKYKAKGKSIYAR